MSYDTDKIRPGAQRIDIVQVDLGKCLNTFGVAPCTATGSKCVNGWEGCKDPANYDETDSYLTPSFCTPVSALPTSLTLIPFLQKVTATPGDVTPEDGVGQVGDLTVTLRDAPHDDVGIDPYVSTRLYNPLTQGTFWPKMRARWPHYQGRNARWYTGYIHSPFSLSNLKCLHYVVESISGYGGKKGVTLKLKDPLKLADDDRAQFPKKSTGTLAVAITAVSSPTTIDIATSENTEYDLFPFESLSAVEMSGEVFQYTGATIITGGVRLTGVTRGPMAPYISETKAHDVGDDVQKCAYWDDMLPPVIIGRLLTLGVEGVDAAWVPYATTWTDLYTFWLGSQTMTRLVTKPEGVRQQISDILQQSNSWGLWWDEVEQEFGYEVFRPAALNESVEIIDDDANVVRGSMDLADDVGKLVNDCVILHGQIDPTESATEDKNYSQASGYIDGQSVDSKEVGSYRTKVIHAMWHATTNSTTMRRIAQRIVTSRAGVPFVATFEVHRKDDALKTGSFVDLRTAGVVDQEGNARLVRMRIVRADYGGETVKYTAREDFVSNRYGLIAPDSLRGTTWTTATEAQRMTYVFIANNDGFYSDGTPGKRIY